MPMFTVSSGSFPVGNYTAVFLGVVAHPEDKVRGYSSGLKWEWQIDAGPYSGRIASRITGPTPSPTNSCGRMLAGLIGRPRRGRGIYDRRSRQPGQTAPDDHG